MRYAWVFNLDADFELTQRSYNTTALLNEQLAPHREAARVLMGPQDVLLEDADVSCTGRAWSPTPHAISMMEKAGVVPEPHPTPEVLRRVNHRLFAHQLGGGLRNQHYVTDELSLLDVLRNESSPWMLKRPLSFAGRGQLRVQGPLDHKQHAWVAASLRVDGLVVEPLVVPTAEFSLHGFVWRDGTHELGRVCQQEVSPRGVFQKVSLAEPRALSDHESAVLHESATRVAKHLSLAGYFGPFGIDAYRYTAPFGDGFCALSEINARYTMAFAVGFKRPVCELIL